MVTLSLRVKIKVLCIISTIVIFGIILTLMLSSCSISTINDIDAVEPSLNANGDMIAFVSIDSKLQKLFFGKANLCSNVYVYNITHNKISCVSSNYKGMLSNGDSIHPIIIGNKVLYVSDDKDQINKVDGLQRDIYLYDITNGKKVRVNQNNNIPAHYLCFKPAISADGKTVAFGSRNATFNSRNNPPLDKRIFIKDLTNNSYRTIIGEFPKDITRNGRYIGLSSEYNENNKCMEHSQLYRYDNKKKKYDLLTIGESGDISNADHDIMSRLCLSDDGKIATFCSSASNLIKGDNNNVSDVFIRDCDRSVTIRISCTATGAECTKASGEKSLAMSRDGRYIVFDSYSDNLVKDDKNTYCDAFLYDRITQKIILISRDDDGSQFKCNSGDSGVSITPDGRLVAFTNIHGIYLYDRIQNKTRRLMIM